MEKEIQSNQTHSQFKSHQIVCLEGETAFLYGEVIQVIVKRKFCWVRPLLLAKFGNAARATFITTVPITDLREGADLLLPISFFRPAIDTEIIPLITRLNNIDSSQEDKNNASKQLNYFVKEVWQANSHS